MLNAFKLVCLFVLATVFHWAFALLCVRWGLNVNIILVFVVAFCALLKNPVAYSLAFLCGLFLDFFSVKLFGNNAFTFTICACLICNTVDRFDFDDLFPQMVAVFCLSVLACLLNTVLVGLFAASSAWPGIWSMLGGAVLNAVLTPLVFLMVRRIVGTSSLCRQG
jgi:rod shape-determining protein MreD